MPLNSVLSQSNMKDSFPLHCMLVKYVDAKPSLKESAFTPIAPAPSRTNIMWTIQGTNLYHRERIPTANTPLKLLCCPTSCSKCCHSFLPHTPPLCPPSAHPCHSRWGRTQRVPCRRSQLHQTPPVARHHPRTQLSVDGAV